MKLFTAFCIGLLASSPAAAQFKPGFPPVKASSAALLNLGLCANSINGVSPYLCIDFTDGIYVRSGVQYASFAAMGGTVPSGCTITAATGLQCTGTAVASIAAGNPAAGYMLLEKSAVFTSGSSTQVLASISDGTNVIQSYQLGSAGYCASASANQHYGFGSSPIETAVNVSSAGAISCSIGGHAETPTGTPPAASSTLYVANNAAGSNPTSSPYAVQSVRIYAGNFTAANLNTAVTQ